MCQSPAPSPGDGTGDWHIAPISGPCVGLMWGSHLSYTCERSPRPRPTPIPAPIHTPTYAPVAPAPIPTPTLPTPTHPHPPTPTPTLTLVKRIGNARARHMLCHTWYDSCGMHNRKLGLNLLTHFGALTRVRAPSSCIGMCGITAIPANYHCIELYRRKEGRICIVCLTNSSLAESAPLVAMLRPLRTAR